MSTELSQRGFVQRLINDDCLFRQALADLTAAHPSNLIDMQRTKDSSLTHAEQTKALLNLASNTDSVFVSSPTIRRLRVICEHSKTILDQMQNSEALWRDVFSRIGHPMHGPISIESVHPSGRCNYLFRVGDTNKRYVVRYHDPLGKEFLQRHEPMRAVEIYCVAAELIGSHLSSDTTIRPLFPTPFSWRGYDITQPEESIPTAELVLSRLLVMEDYFHNHFLLIQHNEAVPQVDWKKLVLRLASPQGEWHARSCRFAILESAANSGCWATPERTKKLMRFRNSGDYGIWLTTRNWIQARLAAANSSSITGRLPFLKKELEKGWVRLAEDSAAAMLEAPALGHFDHTPRNCFLPIGSQDHTVVFDFDYVATVDPAYDAGITLASLIRRMAANPVLHQPMDLTEVANEFLLKYQESYENANRYGALSIQPREVNALLVRIRQFGGFALGAGRDEAGTDDEAIVGSLARTATELLAPKLR